MTNSETIPERKEERNSEINDGKGRLWTGVFLLIAGGAALAKSFYVPMPEWLFGWQTFLIAIGVFIGIRKNFHGTGWLIMIMIGGIFLLNDYYFYGDLHGHVWPLIFILLGLSFILRQRGGRSWRRNNNRNANYGSLKDSDDFADITVLFGSARKKLATKDFKGGDITSIFGGTELDLTNADFEEEAVIDITTIFGGVQLIVPSNWTIKSDVTTIFGSVSDQREMIPPTAGYHGKTLVLDGTAICGGIEIRSFRK